jgi:predicted nuclease with TOPRIM domain
MQGSIEEMSDNHAAEVQELKQKCQSLENIVGLVGRCNDEMEARLQESRRQIEALEAERSRLMAVNRSLQDEVRRYKAAYMSNV